MISEDQKTSRRGPAVLLAFFLSVLLGVPAPAASFADPLPSGIKSLQPGKASPAARLPRRASDDRADPTDTTPLWLGAVPRVETQLLSVRPGTAGAPAPRVAGRKPVRRPYQARAPPAA